MSDTTNQPLCVIIVTPACVSIKVEMPGFGASPVTGREFKEIVEHNLDREVKLATDPTHGR